MENAADNQKNWYSRREFQWALAFVLYLLMSLWLISPAYVDSQDRIIGGGELGGWLWRYWWMKIEIVALGQKYADSPWTQFLQIVSLGRYPETGNITDLYSISVPLDLLFGHPGHYNAKVALIFLTNALSAYAYIYYLTGRRGVALVSGVTLAVNTFIFYEVQGSGLRQAILCFIPLYALFLDRAMKERKTWLGFMAGLFFALTAIYYWFYGLFLAMYSVLRFFWILRRMPRPARVELLKPIAAFVITAPILVLPFMWPYISPDFKDPNAAQLPEVSFFKNFPTLMALQNAPLRPETPYQNLLASLARVLYSSWNPDWAFHQLHSTVVPVVMILFALVIGAWRWKRTGFWLVVFLLFYTLTWGPYLQYDEEFIKIGSASIRLPYWYAFKFIPMMSRLFAPYRIGSMAIFAMTVLLGLNLAAIAKRLEHRPKLSILLGTLFIVAYVGQFHLDPMRHLGIGSNKKLPLKASEVTIPSWYYQLAKEPGRIGIIELPLDRQQDLLNYYQIVHAKKVMGGWATPGALPPKLKADKHPNKVTALLQWLALPDGQDKNPLSSAMRKLGEMPYKLQPFEREDQARVFEAGYRYAVLHELGCYLLEPRWGKELYQRMKSQLESELGEPLTEFVELDATSDAEEMIPYLNGMPWVPSIYSPLLIPEPRPWPMRMVVYSLDPDHESSMPEGEEETPVD